MPWGRGPRLRHPGALPRRCIEVIASSAARLLFRPASDCHFWLGRGANDDSAIGTYLEAITPDACALVGPFAGSRRLPPSLPKDHGLKLPELLAHLNLAPGPLTTLWRSTTTRGRESRAEAATCRRTSTTSR